MVSIWLALLCVALAFALGWLTARVFFVLNAVRQALEKEHQRPMTLGEAAVFFETEQRRHAEKRRVNGE